MPYWADESGDKIFPRKPGAEGQAKRLTNRHPVSRALAAERAKEAIQLRIQGYSLDEIAKKIGYANPSVAHNAISRGLKQSLKEPADELRTLLNQRLNSQIRSLWPTAVGSPEVVNTNPPGQPSNGKAAVPPDCAAHLRLLQISDRQAKLNGLDAPFVVTAMTTHVYESQLDRVYGSGPTDMIPEDVADNE